MKKIFTLLAILTPLLTLAQFPGDCEGDRYTDTIYTEIESETILFGRNANAAGDTLDLEMLLFHNPDDDEINKPVVVLGFGGAYIAGAKETLIPTCQEIARQGMIAVTIDYRIWPILELGQPNLLEFYDTAIKSIGDMKASVRKIRQLADGDNPYNIDSERIIVGGYSAGAVTALHHAYLDSGDNISAELQGLISANGGFEGNSGFPETDNYSSEAQGVINFSGAILDSSFINSGEVPVLSLHGDADETVPYDVGLALGLVPMQGSAVVHRQAMRNNVYSKLKTIEGGGHTDIYNVNGPFAEEFREFIQLRDTFFTDVLCGIVSAEEIALPSVKVNAYPNPVKNVFTIEKEQMIFDSYQMYDVSGKIIKQADNLNQLNTLRIETNSLANGVYYINLGIKDIDNQLRGAQLKMVKI